MNFQEL